MHTNEFSPFSHPEYGYFLDTYKKLPIRFGKFILLVVTTILGILFPFLYGIYRFYYAYKHFGIVVAWNWSFVWFLISFSFGIFLIILMSFTIDKNDPLILYTNGILFLNRKNKRFVAWNEVIALRTTLIWEQFLHHKYQPKYKLTMYLYDNSKIKLDDSTENLSALISQIKAKVYKNLLPKIEESYINGNLISFGRLSIQKDYIQINNRRKPNRIPWTEIESITINSGKLNINQKNHQVLQIMISQIDNFEILINIIQRGVKE